jgi:hypothetical protein
MYEPPEAEALAALGVDRGASWQQIKDAYRSLMRVEHPDRGGRTERAAFLNTAFAVLERHRLGRSAPPSANGAASPRVSDRASGFDDSTAVIALEDDSLAIVAPGDEAFERLMAAVDTLGSLTYVDESAAYFEAVLSPPAGACQLVVNLQGRGETTEAWFSLEALGPYPAPELTEVVREIAARVRRQSPN